VEKLRVGKADSTSQKPMNAEEDNVITCPFCFEQISIRVEPAAGAEQSYIYDCEVCCRPIELTVSSSAGGFQVKAERS